MCYKVFGFDLDGTLTCSISGKWVPINGEDFVFLPNIENVFDARRDAPMYIITNQGGVSHGKPLLDSMDYLVMVNRKLGFFFKDVLVCYHHPTGRCADRYKDFRKPKPDMLLWVVEENGINPREMLFVGNSFDDYNAAKCAGVDFIWAHDFFAWEKEWYHRTDYGYELLADFKEKWIVEKLQKSKKNSL